MTATILDATTIEGVDLSRPIPCGGKACLPREATWRVVLIPPCGCVHHDFACDPCRSHVIGHRSWHALQRHVCNRCGVWSSAVPSAITRWEPLR